MSHTFIEGHEELSLQLTRKLPPCRLDLTVPKGIIHTAKGRKTLLVLTKCGVCMLQYGPAMKDELWLKSKMTDMGVTSCFLIGFEACSTGGHSCLLLKIWSRALGCHTS